MGDEEFAHVASNSNGFNNSIKRKQNGSNMSSKHKRGLRNEVIELSDTENVSTIRTDKYQNEMQTNIQDRIKSFTGGNSRKILS